MNELLYMGGLQGYLNVLKEINLAQVWEQVLAQVERVPTQSLLRQTCILLEFDGQRARVGSKSQNLFKAVKDRVPLLEQAFQMVYQQPIKVSLEVILEHI